MDSRLAIDTAVLLLYFIVIISIGLYMGRKEESLKDFALGGRANSVVGRARFDHRRGNKRRHFFRNAGRRLHVSAITPICNSPSAQSSARILVSYIFIKPYYDYKVYSIYEYLTARFGVPTKNAASAIFMVTRVLASGARLYVAAIALALAYEMIRGVQPGQKETLFIYIGSTIAIVILTAIYTTSRWYQSGHLDRFHSGLDHDWQRVDRARFALLRTSQAAGTRSCNATAHFKFRISSPPASIRQNTAGTKSKECSRSSTRSLPA